MLPLRVRIRDVAPDDADRSPDWDARVHEFDLAWAWLETDGATRLVDAVVRWARPLPPPDRRAHETATDEMLEADQVVVECDWQGAKAAVVSRPAGGPEKLTPLDAATLEYVRRVYLVHAAGKLMS